MHERSNSSPSSQPTGEKWARVFSLYDDTVLVCNVFGKQLDMRLVHLTKRPWLEKELEIQQSIIGSEHRMDQMKKKFESRQAGRFIFDSDIVKNISVENMSSHGLNLA